MSDDAVREFCDAWLRVNAWKDSGAQAYRSVKEAVGAQMERRGLVSVASGEWFVNLSRKHKQPSVQLSPEVMVQAVCRARERGAVTPESLKESIQGIVAVQEKTTRLAVEVAKKASGDVAQVDAATQALVDCFIALHERKAAGVSGDDKERIKELHDEMLPRLRKRGFEIVDAGSARLLLSHCTRLKRVPPRPSTAEQIALKLCATINVDRTKFADLSDLLAAEFQRYRLDHQSEVEEIRVSPI